MSSARWLTPPDPAAIALLQCPRLPCLRALLQREPPAAGRACFVRLRSVDGAAVDEAVVLGDAAHVMISCHGGPGVRAAVEGALAGHGIDLAADAGTTPRLDDHWQRLAACPHPAGVQWLLRNPGTTVPEPAGVWWRPLQVLLAGSVNAGKSTLLNAWCGHARALVSDRAGTTRDAVATDALALGWRLRLFDSAGERADAEDLERAGQAIARSLRQRVDVVVRLHPPEEWDTAAGDDAAGDDAGSPAGPMEIRLFSQRDRTSAPPPGLGWAAPHAVGEAAAAADLQALSQAIVSALGLPCGNPDSST